jgi:hypothetical protein
MWMQRMPLSGDFCVPFGMLDNRQRQETQTTLTKYLFRNICVLQFKSVPGRVQDKGLKAEGGGGAEQPYF